MKIRPKVFEDAMQCVGDRLGCGGALYFSNASREEWKFFNALFRGGFGGFTWDKQGYTSRIIALQLAACVARDENKKKP